MEVQFLGATGEVTGSKHLLKLINGQQILLDCGMFQGINGEEDEYRKNEHLGFDPKQIDCLILTHSHIDHSGLIPRLIKEGFEGPIYATSPTKDLCRIMLEDSAQIQQEDLKALNKKRVKKGKAPVKALYEKEDVKKSLGHFITVPYNRNIQLGKGVNFYFTDAGHILGSAAINLTIMENGENICLTYTGDIGRPEDEILKAPESFPQADVILTESTYGNKLHAKQEDLAEKLGGIIWEACYERKGRLIIPAFSLDRTQDIVFMLDKLFRKNKLPDVKIFVDSPLATRVTEIMREHTTCFNEEMLKYMREDPHPFQFEKLYYTENVEDSKALNDLKEPAVIISASGMMEGGRIKHHLLHHIEKPDTTLVLVGYSTPGSLGGQIQSGVKTIQVFGQELQIHAKVESIDGFSAHADYQEILDYLGCQNPSEVGQVFLVHGEPDALAGLEEQLNGQDFKYTTIPKKGESYSILKESGVLKVAAISDAEVT